MLRSRDRELTEESKGLRPPVAMDVPIVKNNVYKLDAWMSPFADVQTLH